MQNASKVINLQYFDSASESYKNEGSNYIKYGLVIETGYDIFINKPMVNCCMVFNRIIAVSGIINNKSSKI